MERRVGDMRPDYVVVADELRQAIVDGKITLGALLPSHAALSKHYQTSLPTVQKAVNVLKGEGYVAAVHGKGTYVVARRPAVTSQDHTMRALAAIDQHVDVLTRHLREIKQSLKKVIGPTGGPNPRSYRFHA
jgi:DNA-binding GntR family transcriptional regulator